MQRSKRALLAVGLVILMVSLMTACSVANTEPNASTSANEMKKYEAEFIGLFDTVTQMVGYADSEASFQQVAEAIKSDLGGYHRLYDIYNSYPGLTNLKDINDQAGQGPVQVDPRIIDLLKYGQYMYDLTGGKINIAMGAVLTIWHDYRTAGIDDPDNAELPDLAVLQEANRHTNINDLIINEASQTVELKDPAMSLDVGAIAKGFATEQTAQAAVSRGVRHILLSVGGNVRAIGYRNDANEPWRAGIQDPDPPEGQSGSYLTIVNIHDTSVVTSGSYERYYEVAGKRYHHIIDPISLFPENRYLSVTIITPDSGLADALSTALFNMDYADGLALVNSLDQVHVLWCFPDGSLKKTDGFKDLENPS